MKKSPFPFFLPVLIIGFISCSPENSEKTTIDSIPQMIVDSNKISIKTDSGRLEIEKKADRKEAKAILFDEKGKVLQSGMFFEGKPAGAWLKYDASGNVVSAIHYSNGQPKYELDKNDFYFRQWSNKEMGITINVPKNWSEQKFSSTDLIAFEKPIADTSIHFKPNFSIEHATLLPNETIEKLALMQIQILHDNVGRVELIEESYFTVDSLKAFRRYGMFYDDNTAIGFLSAIIISDQSAWFVTCEAENKKTGDFLKYQGVFQEIVANFRRIK